MTRMAAARARFRFRPFLALVLLAVAALVAALAAACNTVDGFRKDIEILGRDIDQKVDEMK